MSKGPEVFSDIGMKAKNLLMRDYTLDQKLSVSTLSNTGVALTSSASCQGGLSTGDVETMYMYKNATIGLKVDTLSNILATCTITELLPSTMALASFQLPDYMIGMLEIQYFHDHATFTASTTFGQSPMIDVSATLGTPNISFGAEAAYDASTRTLSKYTTGISVAKPYSCASIILGDMGDTMRASYIHLMDESKKSAVVGEIVRRFSTNENTFTVGGSYAVDPLTVVKAKLNNHGKLAALMQHEVIPNSLLAISGELDTQTLDKHPKFGLAIALNP